LARWLAVVGAAQGDCAARYQSRDAVQPGSGTVCRVLPVGLAVPDKLLALADEVIE
jgi:hypothetical protein